MPAIALGAGGAPQQGAVYFVAVNGSDETGDGSAERPWASITHAAEAIPDASAIVVVGDGTYKDVVLITRSYSSPVVFRAANPFRARLVNRSEGAAVNLFGGNFTLTGFHIRGSSLSAVIVGKGAHAIQIRDNILTLDEATDEGILTMVLSIQGDTTNIVVEGNTVDGLVSDEFLGWAALIHVGRSTGVWLHRNVIFGSSAATDIHQPAVLVAGSRDLVIDGNVFLGLTAGPVLRFSAIDAPDFPPTNTHVDNNLFLAVGGQRAAPVLAIEAARDLQFRANTVVGPLGAEPFALSLAAPLGGPANSNIGLYNNIFSDPTGAMGDLASGPVTSTLGLALGNNLYWNGGAPIPNFGDGPTVADDPDAIVADPLLPATTGVIPPRWDPETGTFGGGHRTIREVFAALGELARTAPGSPAIDHADGEHMPLTDLFGRPRGSPDIGALEYRPPGPPTPTATATPAARIHLPWNGRETQ